MQQTVTLEANVSQVDTSSRAVNLLVEQKQISEAPLNRRTYTQLISIRSGGTGRFRDARPITRLSDRGTPGGSERVIALEIALALFWQSKERGCQPPRPFSLRDTHPDRC
jgi:hypothetical protein